MKKSLITFLVFALIFTMAVPAFADHHMESAGQQLNELGIIKGDGSDLMEDSTWKRQDLAVLLSRLTGSEAAAEATAKSHTYADVTSAYYDGFLSWAREMKYMEGHSAVKFGFNEELTAQQFYAVVLRVLGYDTTGANYANTGALAVEAGLAAEGTDFSAPANRGTTYEGIVAALSFEDSEGVTLGANLGLAPYVAAEEAEAAAAAAEEAVAAYEAAPITTLEEVTAAEALQAAADTAVAAVADADAKAAFEARVTAQAEKVAAAKTSLSVLSVESITAINTKQIAVKFNKAVDKTTAETATNYTVGGVAYDKAVLQADGMTVVATMAGETKVTNATEVEFKVLKAVKDAGGTALAADYAQKITVVDTTSPTFASVEAVGVKTLKVTFSEPIMDNGANTALETDLITVKSGIYNYVVTSSVADYAARTVTLTLGTNLIEGSVTVKVNAQGMSDANALRDFAGLVIVPSEQVYQYVKDTSIATAELTSVNKATKVAKVTFSKPVYGTDVKLYHSVNGSAAYGTAAVSKTEANAATEWEFTFTNDLPSGALTFYLVNDSDAAKQISDLFGVKVPNGMFSYTVVADTTAPTVVNATVSTNAYFEVEFSEDVATAEVKADNFEVKKSDGTVVTVAVTHPSAKVARLTASLVDNTDYTVTVKAMKDVAGNALVASYSKVLSVGDNVHPTATAYITDAKTLYVTFSEDMNAADIGNKSNYLVDATTGAGTAFIALDGDDTLTVINSKKVKITFNDNNLDANDDVRIGAVKDLAGKALVSATTFSTDVNITADSLTYTAELIAVNKIKIKFSKELSVFDNTDFTVAGAAILSIESNSVNADGKTDVVIVLDTDLASNATPAVTAVAQKTKSSEGTPVTLGAVNAADKVAPTVDRIVFVSATEIQVIFKETLEADLFAATGKNGFSVTGGTLTSALEMGGVDTNTVILTGTDFTVNTDVAYNGTNGLVDMAGNVVAAISRTDALTAAAISVAVDAANEQLDVTSNFYGYSLNIALITAKIDAIHADITNTTATLSNNSYTFVADVANGAQGGAITATDLTETKTGKTVTVATFNVTSAGAGVAGAVTIN